MGNYYAIMGNDVFFFVTLQFENSHFQQITL